MRFVNCAKAHTTFRCISFGMMSSVHRLSWNEYLWQWWPFGSSAHVNSSDVVVTGPVTITQGIWTIGNAHIYTCFARSGTRNDKPETPRNAPTQSDERNATSSVRFTVSHYFPHHVMAFTWCAFFCVADAISLCESRYW
jgi:hypothetical protein